MQAGQGMAHVEDLDEKSDSRNELAEPQASGFVVYSIIGLCVCQIRPCFETSELVPGLSKRWIGPEFLPNQHVPAIHFCGVLEAFSNLRRFQQFAVDISAKCCASFVPN
jgi:hypothetical protein